MTSNGIRPTDSAPDVFSTPAPVSAPPVPPGGDGDTPVLADDMRVLIERQAAAWESMRTVICTSSQESLFTGWIQAYYSGIPPEVVRVAPQGIYRHYIQRHDQVNAIIASALLKQGATACWRKVNNTIQHFTNMRGVFLTRPWMRPERVGCPAPAGYVDVRIPTDTPLYHVGLYSEADEIFVVPGMNRNESGSAEIPLKIRRSSLDLPRFEFTTHQELIAALSTMVIPAGLEAFCYHVADDWQRPLAIGGVTVPNLNSSRVHPHHGVAHHVRTAALAVWIGAREGIAADAVEMKALLLAGLLHDIGRKTNYGARDEISHAESSAAQAAFYFEHNAIERAVRDVALQAIRDHVTPAAEITSKTSLILKDADGLDRFRFGSYGCDPSLLTTDTAQELVPLMDSFFNPAIPSFSAFRFAPPIRSIPFVGALTCRR